MLSAEREVALDLHRELAAKLEESDVRDFKWKKLKNAKYRFAAEKIVDSIANRLSTARIRIDVLCWDTHDSRHAIPGRDDVANLQRMYFHLFHNVMKMRWRSACTWKHMPDEQTALDWESVEYYLRRKGYSRVAELDQICGDLEEDATFGGVLKKNFGVHEITACKSHEMTLCQVADLFAGATCYSREHYAEYKAWKAEQGYATSLFPDDAKTSASNGELEKNSMVQYIACKIRQAGLAIDLDKHKGFRTLDPKSPLNFWWYEPKSSQDKAPFGVRQN